jgi:SAM-dependent methyltransferase
LQDVVHAEYRAHAQDHWWFAGRRRIFARLLARYGPRGGQARILDVGPGSGVNLPVLGPLGKVTVLDLDLGSLRSAVGAGAAAGVCGDAVHAPFTPGSFDLVCMLDVVEHLEEDAAALAAARALLKPDGIVLLSVPALRVLWGRQDVLSGHKRRYRKHELATAVGRAGLWIERLSYFNTWLLPPILLVRLLMRPFVGASARSGSDFGLRVRFLDGVLRAIFASEASWLDRHDLPIGVSLLCVARRERPA